MSRKRNLIKWLLISVVSVCALLAMLVIAAPWLIDTEAVRSKITTLASRQIGGKVDYQRLGLEILPLPGIRLYGLAVEVPGTGRLQMESVGVYPRIWPLLTGRLSLARFHLEKPFIQMEMPQRAPDPESPAEKKAPQLDDIQKKTSAILSDLSEKAPDTRMVVSGGRLELVSSGKVLLSVENIDGKFISQREDISLDIACSSSAWEQLALQTKLDPATLAASGQIKAVNLHYRDLRDAFFPEAEIPITESTLNLEATFTSEGPAQMSARWTASLPVLSIQLKNEKVELPVNRLGGEIQMTADTLQLALSDIQIAKPALSLSGRLLKASTSPRITIEAKIPKDNLEPIREMTLKLLGDTPTVKAITDVVRAGTATNTLVRLQGDSWADLGALNSFYLQGGMVGGNIFVPGLELDLKNVNGEVTVADGVLSCRNVDATLGKNGLSGGIFTLGLAGGEVPLHLEADILADLKELPGILEKTISDKAILEQVRAISQIDGQAQGKLTLGESTRKIDIAVEVKKIQATVKHRAIPYPVKLTGGRFAFKGNRLDATDLSGSIGQSAFDKLTGQLTLAAPFPVALTAAGLKFNLEENLEWANHHETLRNAFSDIRSLRGTAGLTNVTLKGPLAAPQEWVAKAKGSAAEVLFDSDLLPGVLMIRNTNIDAAVKEGRLVMTHTDTEAMLLDAELHLSGSLERGEEGIDHTEVSFSGNMQSESLKYLLKLLHQPQINEIRSPIEISGGHLLWEKEVINVGANLQIPAAPTIIMDLHQAPGELNVRVQLSRQGAKIADSTLVISGKTAELAFNGEIDDATIAQFVTTPGFQPGKLRGDFKARILLDQPRRSSATGRLEIKNILFPWDLPVPIRIHEAMLTGKGDRLIVETAELICQEQKLDLKGEIGFVDKGIQLKMNLAGDGFDLTPVVNAFSEEPGKENPPEKAGAPGKDRKRDKKAAAGEELPLYGTIHVGVGQLTYDRFVWKPFRAQAALRPGRIDVTVAEAALCGIQTPGKLSYTPQEISLDFKATAEKQPLDKSMGCLLGPDVRMSGTFDMNGAFSGRGSPQELAESIEGKVEFISRDGRIYKDFLFMNILQFLSITEVLTLHLPDLGREGFGYYSIETQADLKNGKALIAHSVMDAHAVDIALAGEVDYLHQTMDIKGLVAPLKTVRRIIDLIPIIGRPISGTFATIPIQAKGSWENPKVETAFVSSIAPGLESFLKDLN